VTGQRRRERDQRRISSFVGASLRGLHVGRGLALDIPCGHGRHSLLLAKLGMQVISADLDPTALLAARAANREQLRTILALRLDANRPLPFKDGVFDLVVVVHFSLFEIVRSVAPVLKVGGHLILETYGAQGENWRELPRKDDVASQLARQFELLKYIERSVRRAPERVTLKAVCRKLRFTGENKAHVA